MRRHSTTTPAGYPYRREKQWDNWRYSYLMILSWLSSSCKNMISRNVLCSTRARFRDTFMFTGALKKQSLHVRQVEIHRTSMENKMRGTNSREVGVQQALRVFRSMQYETLGVRGPALMCRLKIAAHGEAKIITWASVAFWKASKIFLTATTERSFLLIACHTIPYA